MSDEPAGSLLSAKNEEELELLSRFLKLSNGFEFFIVTVSGRSLLETVTKALEDNGFPLYGINVGECDPDAIVGYIIERYTQMQTDPSAWRAVLCYGGEYWSPRENRRAFTRLNELRDLFVSHLAHPLLLCLNSTQLPEFVKHAPDLWAIRTSMFKFEAAFSPASWPTVLETDSYMELEEPTAYEQQVRRLLPRQSEPDAAQLLVRLLWKWGRSLAVHGNLDEAQHAWGRALLLAETLDDKSMSGRIHLSSGSAFIRQGRLNEAEVALVIARQRFEEAKNLQGEADVLTQQGELARLRGHYPEALTHFSTARDIYARLNLRPGEARVELMIGEVKRIEGELDEAQSRAHRAFELFSAVGEPRGRGNALHLEAVTKLAAGRLHEAHQLLNRAEEEFASVQDARGRAMVIAELAQLFIQWGELEKAREAADEAVGLYRRLYDQNGLANALFRRWTVSRMRGQWDDLDRDFQECRAIYQASGNALGEANLAFVQAQEVARTGQAHDALGALYAALQKYTEIGDRVGQINSADEIARLYFRHGDYVNAEREFRRALELSRLARQPLAEANATRGLAEVLLRTARHMEFHAMVAQARSLYQRLDVKLGIGRCLCLEAEDAISDGRPADAMQLVGKARGMFEAAQSTIGQADASLLSAMAAFEQKQVQQAMDDVDLALRLYTDLGDMYGKKRSLEMRSRIFEALGRHDLAILSRNAAESLQVTL